MSEEGSLMVGTKMTFLSCGQDRTNALINAQHCCCLDKACTRSSHSTFQDGGGGALEELWKGNTLYPKQNRFLS